MKNKKYYRKGILKQNGGFLGKRKKALDKKILRKTRTKNANLWNKLWKLGTLKKEDF